MQITALSPQLRNPDRVNVSIDGAYRLSLDIGQVIDLDVKVGRELDAEELALLEQESQFGKLYVRALEYCLSRPHSVREVREYLWRKTRATTYKTRSGELRQRPGVSEELAERVLLKLQQKNYVNDEQFARWWVEHRHLRKGASQRKLRTELQTKGVAGDIIQQTLDVSGRTDDEELAKMIAKKRARYADDPQKLMHYLVRQGFSYDDVKAALRDDAS